MSTGFDVEKGVAAVNDLLTAWGFSMGEADSDWRKDGDRGLRFKTGTSYGEVTVTTWIGADQVDVNRAFTVDQVGDLLRYLSGRIRFATELNAEMDANP